MNRLLLSKVVLAFTAVALLVPAAAHASNIAPNPSFESDCGGAPCLWTAAGATITQDLGDKVSGTASLKLVATGTLWGYAYACAPAGPGTYGTGFSDKTASVNVAQILFYVTFFSAPNCANGTFISQTSIGNSQFDGQWHHTSGTSTAPPGTASAEVSVFVGCVTNPCQGATAYFDDVTLDGTTTAATIRSLTATRSPAGTLLRWRTASELEVAGFNVYRLEHGRAVKVNRHLIAAKARGGASYRLLDRGHRGARYRLEIVNLDGTRQTRTVR